jgi:flagellar biosynthesis/type III secretory pathway protein FliH
VLAIEREQGIEKGREEGREQGREEVGRGSGVQMRMNESRQIQKNVRQVT